MKFGLIVVLTLAVGSLAAHFLLEDNGYVLINFRGYAIEMSVPVLIFILFLMYLAARLIIGIWRAPRQIGKAAALAKQRRVAGQVNKGLIALAEGRLSRGERLLTKSARSSQMPLLQYLAGARAAQMQGDHDRRDGWLKMAFEQDASAGNAILLTQADLQLADGDNEQARASLNRIRESQPQHPEALKLLAILHHREQDWPALTDLLPILRRQKNISRKQLDQWTVETYTALFAGPGLSRTGIDELWHTLPRQLRKNSAMIRARIQALVVAGETDSAEIEIRKALRSQWDAVLVLLYGELEWANADAQLSQVESWLLKRPEDSGLLLTAGRICIRNQLWGKARSYLESSIGISPTSAAYQELGQLMLKIGEDESATQAFQKGLTLTKGLPGLPRLEGKI
jgi:HemY protein